MFLDALYAMLGEAGDSEDKRKREVKQQAERTARSAFPDGRGSDAAIEQLTNAHVKRAEGNPLRATSRLKSSTIPISSRTFQIKR